MDNGNPQPQNQYTINNVQQLFAINNNLVNFQAKFIVKSLSGEPFQGLVVNQSMLDSGQSLEFRAADQGVFSGEITQDNNVPDNWYLALKAPKPNKVSVDIQAIPIAARPEGPVVAAKSAQSTQQSQRQSSQRQNGSSGSSGSSGWFNFQSLFKLLIGAGVISMIYVLFKRFWKPRNRKAAHAIRYDGGESSAADDAFAAATAGFGGGDAASAAQSVQVSTSAAPVTTVAPPAPPAAAAVAIEGTSTASVLGEDLLAKVKNLPEV